MSLISKLQHKLYQPVDIAFLVYFRIAGGILIAIELSLFLPRVERFMQTDMYFSYLFFSWVQPWSVTGLYVLMLTIILLALMVGMGFYYRITTILFFLAQLLFFLMDKAVYQNHTYLYLLVSFLLIFLPAHRAFSLDVCRRPSLLLSQVSTWVWYLLMFQISVVYMYAGIAKLYGDWLDGRPMVIWMFHKSDHPIIGPLLGTFPWFALMMTFLFFPPSWPRNLLNGVLPAKPTSTVVINRSSWVIPLLSAYVLIQLFLPLRHWLYPIDTAWTDEGSQFAWQMMLRIKGGQLDYQIRDQQQQLVALDQGKRLTSFQRSIMQGDPGMMLQYAHHLANCYQDALGQPVQVYLNTQNSLNGWEFQQMVDPTVDLAQQKRTLGHYSWIMPWKPVSPLATTQ